jgi:hypothetical protein
MIIGFVWLFLGPAVFIALGGAAYLLLDIAYGAGMNTEGTATQSQRYLSSIAGPSFLTLAGGGTLLSLFMAFRTLTRKNRRNVVEAQL